MTDLLPRRTMDFMFRRITFSVCLALMASGCVTPNMRVRRETPPPEPVDLSATTPSEGAEEGAGAPSETDHPKPDPSLPLRRALVETARQTLGRIRGPGDCVAFIRVAYRHVGRPLPDASEPGDNAVTGLYRALEAQGRAFKGALPQPGDLVFFEETYDRNRDGLRNDGLTHVGLVESVDAEGTVALIHRGSHGASRIWMDLGRPDEWRDAQTGKVLNQPLRRSVAHGIAHLTGQLFYAYARVLSEEPLPIRTVSR